MQVLTNIPELIQNYSLAFTIGAVITFIIGSVAQWRLFEKAGQPGYAIFIPVWNIVVSLKIIGRPANHALFLLIPGFNIYFILKIITETCESFGKRETIDYIFAIAFNMLYIFNIGLAYDVSYKGPIYLTRKKNRNNPINSNSSIQLV
jgi:signal peptidase I